MEIERRPFQGVLNILSFNRHFYVIGLAILALIIAVHIYFSWPTAVLCFIISAFAYGLIMPLVVSAYVYDLSGYYDLHWLDDIAERSTKPLKLLNINAGFDETSFLLQARFPEAEIKVFDFYDAKRHTEPAIVRARKVSHVFPGTLQIRSNAIPLEDAAADLIFLLSAAHEIRSNEEKIQFLKECRRLCKPGAKVIMVEHLRDFPNFLAFTVGFTHFFSAGTWRHAFEKAGFSVSEKKFTPFMSVFTCTI